MREPIELYAFWRTSATYRIRVALKLKGLPVTEKFINNDAGENRSEAFLKINPLGGLPVLVEKGHPPLTQSLAILEFIDELQAQPPLLPGDLHGRARVRAIASMLAADTHPFITPRVKKFLIANAGYDDARFRAWQIHWLTTGLRAVEQRLAESQTGTFCHGDEVTIADICLASIIAVMRVFKITVPDTPIIDRIISRCDGVAAFAESDPYLQEGAPSKS